MMMMKNITFYCIVQRHTFETQHRCNICHFSFPVFLSSAAEQGPKKEDLRKPIVVVRCCFLFAVCLFDCRTIVGVLYCFPFAFYRTVRGVGTELALGFRQLGRVGRSILLLQGCQGQLCRFLRLVLKCKVQGGFQGGLLQPLLLARWVPPSCQGGFQGELLQPPLWADRPPPPLLQQSSWHLKYCQELLVTSYRCLANFQQICHQLKAMLSHLFCRSPSPECPGRSHPPC